MMEKKERPAGRGWQAFGRMFCRYTGVIAYNELNPVAKVGAAS